MNKLYGKKKNFIKPVQLIITVFFFFCLVLKNIVSRKETKILNISLPFERIFMNSREHLDSATFYFQNE